MGPWSEGDIKHALKIPTKQYQLSQRGWGQHFFFCGGAYGK